jgi:hypothetical protein
VIADDPVEQLDIDALAAEAAMLLEQLPVGDGIGVKLNRLLFGFLEAEVLPQARRAVDQGLDPTPLFDVVTDILRLYTDALQRPEDAGHWRSTRSP